MQEMELQGGKGSIVGLPTQPEARIRWRLPDNASWSLKPWRTLLCSPRADLMGILEEPRGADRRARYGPKLRLLPLLPLLLLLLLLLLLNPAATAAPVFLDVTTPGQSRPDLLVRAGEKATFVLTLSSPAVATEPQIHVDLAAMAGGLAAPVMSDRAVEVRRSGPSQAGVQRFNFDLLIPVAKNRQNLVLRVRWRASAGDEWLSLPVVTLEASPETWREDLRQFARQISCGRLAGSERLDRIFQAAAVETPETSADAPVTNGGVAIWFAEAGGELLTLPESTAPVWVVFKPEVRGGLELSRATNQTGICVIADSRALNVPEGDPVAQELLERILATVRTLVLPGENK